MTTIDVEELYQRLATDLVEARVRVRALLELLEEKGILEHGEYDTKAEAMWNSDYQDIFDEITTPPPPELDAEDTESPPQSKPLDPHEYAIALMENVVDEAIGMRTRIRAILEVLEEKGVFAPGEYDERAEVIWTRDYEELALDYYKRHF